MTDVAGLGRCVLVDNNPLSFICNPSNGIPVPDFVGNPVRKRSFSHRLLYKNDEFYQDGLGTKKKKFKTQRCLYFLQDDVLPEVLKVRKRIFCASLY